ncbi:MAG: protein kinase [Lachnospiraceae bacterium]|nr:protein kinase [Lachnospiraceae bacterium]
MNYLEELANTYEIYEQIGAGGGGTVYRAVHKRLQKVVVIKKLKSAAMSIMDCRTEVDILKNLRHSYLPQVLDFIESPGGIFTVMDFIPGKSLQNMIDENHKFTEKEILKYTRQLCEALDYLHSQNPPIIHGDIKPDNVMITPEGNVCLIDFNISGILEGKGATTFGYTPGYGAPEQIEAFEKIKKEMMQQAKAKPPVPVMQQVPQQPVQYNQQPAQYNQQPPMSGEATVVLGAETAVLDNATVALGTQPNYGMAQQVQPVNPAMPPQNMPQPSAAPQATQPKGITIDKRSDIYALGATIYTLITGEFRNPKDRKLVLPDTSSGLAVVLNKALAYSPSKRYPDAGKMLQAVISVHKKDKRYKKLLRRQELTFVVLFVMMAASVLCMIKGFKTMSEERKERYDELIECMQEATLDGLDEAEFNELYDEAVRLYAQNQEAYYEKAYYLYTYKGPQETIDYISDIIHNFAYGTSVTKSNLYHLYAECNFEIEDYDKAVRYYEEALTAWTGNEQIYRDYAIALIYLGELEEAEELLDSAMDNGMKKEDIYMVKGELSRINGDYEEAIDYMEDVLSETTDAYTRQRAYVIASEVFGEIGTEEALLRDVEWLNEAVDELEANDRLLIYEHLAQDYIDLADMTKDNSYLSKAVEVLEEIADMGWDNYLTYSNMIVLSQKNGDLDSAIKYGEKMLDRYPNHYVTYLRLCYIEIEEQNRKENKERSYDEFVTYYEKAKECYKKQVSGNVTNAEMQLLEQTYNQILEGGWLE